MGIEQTIRDALMGVAGSIVQFAVDAAPRLLTALVVVLLGILIAKLISIGLRVTLSRLKFDSLLERIGVKQMLQRLGLRQPASHALAKSIYVLLVILFIQSAAVAVGLTTISDAIASFFRYLPNLVAATLIVMFGIIAGQFAGRAVAQAAGESGVDFAPALGRAVSAIIAFVVGLMAIAQLKIDTAVIHTFSTIVLTGMALALALSFGLGTREITRSIVAGFYLRKTLQIGDPIEVKGEQGVLAAITPTQALIERDGATISIANSTLLDAVVKQEAK